MQHFYHKVMTHIKWDVIISSSLRLLLKVWIWYRYQNRKLYHHDGEQLLFYSAYQNTEQKEGCSCNPYIKATAKNSNLFDKTVLKRTSNAIFNMKKVDLDES